jgi:hypothetical protein
MVEMLYSVFARLCEKKLVLKAEISNFQGHFQCLLWLSAKFIEDAPTESSLPSNVVIIREGNLSLAARQPSAKCFFVQRACALSAENGAPINLMMIIN